MKKFLALLTVVSLGFAAQAQAGNFTLTPVVSKAFAAADFSELPTIPDPTMNYGSPIIYQVDIRMDVLGLTGTERSFANTGFTMTFHGGTSDAGDTGWQPDIRNGDSNGATPGGTVPLWFANTDAGTPNDEVGILVSIAAGLTGANDNRRNIGQAAGSQGAVTGTDPYPVGTLGSIFVLWDGVGGAAGSADEDYLLIQDVLFQAADANGVFLVDQTASGANARLTFGTGAGPGVPEPATLTMVGMALVGLAFRRRNG